MGDLVFRSGLSCLSKKDRRRTLFVALPQCGRETELLREEVGRDRSRPLRTLPPPLIPLGGFAEEPSQPVSQGAPVDHDDEDLALAAFRTLDLTHAMPRMPSLCEQQATVA